MTGWEQVALVAAGLGAGVLTSTVGVASLLSFPVLIALGIPPVVANASNTLGLIPASLGGSLGYRRELRGQPGVTWVLVLTAAIGSVGGAVLLLALPSSVFESIVPWLILFTCLLVGAQPWISRWLRSRRHPDDIHPRIALSPATIFFAGPTGVYGGYFGAGAGVMMMAVLSLGLDLELRIVNALKTLALLAANVVAGLIFVFVADLDYTAVGLLAAGSIIGGYAGSHLGRILPPTLLRILVVLAGLIAAITML